MNILLLTPPSSEPLARELAGAHLSDTDARIIVTEPTAPDDEHDHKQHFNRNKQHNLQNVNHFVDQQCNDYQNQHRAP